MADRHRKGYYEEYNKKRKAEGKSTDRHRKGYYAEYNKKHPERLERGYTKGIYTDSLGRPHSRDFYNPTITDLIDSQLMQWHDDDWCEDAD